MVRRRDRLAWAEPPLLVLASLAGGDKHGYAVRQDVLAETGVELGPGTLYSAIARLEEDGFVEPAPGQGEDARRRVYRLTTTGQRELADRLTRMARFADRGIHRLGTVIR